MYVDPFGIPIAPAPLPGRAGAGGVDLVSRRFADGAPPSGLSFFVRMEAVGGDVGPQGILQGREKASFKKLDGHFHICCQVIC